MTRCDSCRSSLRCRCIYLASERHRHRHVPVAYQATSLGSKIFHHRSHQTNRLSKRQDQSCHRLIGLSHRPSRRHGHHEKGSYSQRFHEHSKAGTIACRNGCREAPHATTRKSTAESDKNPRFHSQRPKNASRIRAHLSGAPLSNSQTTI